MNANMTGQIKAGVCKYPKEVYSALTSNKTFSVRSELFAADATKGQSPYKIYDGVFSRFVFTVIQKAKGKQTTFPDANLPVNEVPGLIESSKAANNANTFLSLPVVNQIFLILREVSSLTKRCGDAINVIYKMIKTGKEPKIQETSPDENIGKLAKTVKIANGNYKDKTPFEVLLADPNQADGLKRQHDWLAQNLQKYPNNKGQMDAINEALYMLQNGLIKEGDDVVSTNSLSLGDVVLYEPLPKALIRKEDSNGFCPVYELGIYWHMGDRYPVEVVVKNYKAPVQKTDKGTINPIRQKAIDYTVNNFRMSSSQWFDCLYSMESHMRRFEIINTKNQFLQADQADAANRAVAKAQNSQNPQGQYFSQQNQPGQPM